MLTCGGCRYVDDHGEEDIGRMSSAELRLSALRVQALLQAMLRKEYLQWGRKVTV